jgi:hypothetical protein
MKTSVPPIGYFTAAEPCTTTGVKFLKNNSAEISVCLGFDGRNLFEYVIGSLQRRINRASRISEHEFVLLMR